MITAINRNSCAYKEIYEILKLMPLELVNKMHPDVKVYCACVDKKLNSNKYIVPGLGDAGDRIYGTK